MHSKGMSSSVICPYNYKMHLDTLILSTLAAPPSPPSPQQCTRVMSTACTVFVIVRQVDLITEEHQPLPHLNRRHHGAVGCLPELTVLLKSLQQQLRSCGTGKVQSNHLRVHTSQAQLTRIIHLNTGQYTSTNHTITSSAYVHQRWY